MNKSSKSCILSWLYQPHPPHPPPTPQTPFKLIESISRSFQDIIFTLLNSLRASHWISLDFSWTFSVSSRFFPKAILFSFSVYRRPTDPNFWRFPTKKSSDVVKPFFTWNNSVNLKTEHSNSIEKNRNISYSALCILLIQICECWLLTSSCGTRASYSETTCDFFFSFFFFNPTHRPNIRKRIRRQTKKKERAQLLLIR